MTEPTLTTYEPVRMELPFVAVREQDIDDELRSMASRLPAYEDVCDVPARLNDKVVASVKLFENGALLPGFDGAERVMTLGDGFMPEPFTRGVVGMKAGDEREFSFELPSVGSEGLSTMRACVKVSAVRRRRDAVIDDAWVADHVKGSSTVAELRETIRGRLAEQLVAERERRKRLLCSAELAGRLVGGVTEKDVARALGGVEKAFGEELSRRGQTVAEYLDEQGIDEGGLAARQREQALQAVREGMAAELYGRHMGVQVDDADVDDMFPGKTPEQQAASRERFVRGGGDLGRMRHLAFCEKALDEACRRAIVTDRVSLPPRNPFRC